MRGTRALVLAFVLVVAACGGSADSTSTTEAASTTTSSAATTFTSDDGIIAIEVPADAGIEVSVGTASEVPEEFEDVDLIGPVYELGPDGATFDTPVTITATFEADDLPDDHPANLAFPVLLSSDGTIDILDDLVIEFDADGAVVSGTTSHFSELVFVKLDTLGLLQVALDPAGITLPVGDSFGATIVGEPPAELFVSGWTVGNPTVLSGGGDSSGLTTSFTCENAGRSAYTANVQLGGWQKELVDGFAVLDISAFGVESTSVIAAAQRRPIGSEPTITISGGDITVSGIADCVEEGGPAGAPCDPDGDVGCRRFNVGSYTVITLVPEQVGDSFDMNAHVFGPDGPAAGMDFYGSAWRTDGSPGDADAQHNGPLPLDEDGNIVIRFMGYPGQAFKVYFSYESVVHDAGNYDANGMFIP